MHDVSSITRLAPWLPYVLRPSDPIAGRSAPDLVDLGTGATWSIDVVVNALAALALEWHQQAARWVGSKDRPSVTELKAWINLTRTLADRVPFGTTPDIMRTAAAELERIIATPAQFFATWPAIGTQADANRRASIFLWAIDRVLRAVNEIDTSREYLLTQVWPALFAAANPDDPDPAFADYVGAQKRIATLEQAIIPEQHNLLMATVLRGALGGRIPRLP